MIGGAELAVDCAGTRTEVDGLQAGTVASARAVSGGSAMRRRSRCWRCGRAAPSTTTMISSRPRCLILDGWVPVADPRLSTTYTDTGDPLRTSLELWISDGEDEFPRRAAGEAAGPGAELATDELQMRVAPLRCHSRGQDGAGVYVLASF